MSNLPRLCLTNTCCHIYIYTVCISLIFWFRYFSFNPLTAHGRISEVKQLQNTPQLILTNYSTSASTLQMQLICICSFSFSFVFFTKNVLENLKIINFCCNLFCFKRSTSCKLQLLVLISAIIIVFILC